MQEGILPYQKNSGGFFAAYVSISAIMAFAVLVLLRWQWLRDWIRLLLQTKDAESVSELAEASQESFLLKTPGQYTPGLLSRLSRATTDVGEGTEMVAYTVTTSHIPAPLTSDGRIRGGDLGVVEVGRYP